MDASATTRLHDPDWYVETPVERVHDVFAILRLEDAVHWQDLGDGRSGYWAITRYQDVVEVSRNPQIYSASAGGMLLEDLDDDRLADMRQMLLAMDPPMHTVHRQPLAPNFRAKVVAAMEQDIRSICSAIFRDVGDGDVDLVHDVCARLPSQVIAAIFGLPAEDAPRLQQWAERAAANQDDEIRGEYEVGASGLEIARYFIDLAARRRREPPREDLTSLILASTFDGEPLDDVRFGSFVTQLITAGNDTTKNAISSGILALLDHPEELSALHDDRSLLPLAAEEIFRFANPIHYLRRTAVCDTAIGGTPIAAGDKVAMYYTSANRDERVFGDPQTLRIRRHPNPHLSFGIGTHFCLGAHLARLEVQVFLDELLSTFSSVELTGTLRRIRSNFVNGYKELRVKLTR